MKSRARMSSGKQNFSSAKLSFKKRKEFGTGETIVSQGENCSDVHYVESGLVKLALVSKRGKGAVLGILGEGDFFGEACIGGDAVYSTSAITLAPTCIWIMPGKSMLRMLKEDPGLAMRFMNYLLTRNRRIEQDLIDHMLHFSEKRLARTLLSLGQSGHHGHRMSMLENIGQDTLADMIGTTRSRVNFFMNKFRKSGHIDYSYGGGLKVYDSLVAVLQD
jgi:CRP/FNR family transcriptional regulator, cyclic AMP receptor protein